MDNTEKIDPAYAVVVQNAYKKYGNGPYVLKNLNMNIPRNQIYGLLGSSGCGKTTLLKTLIGATDLDYGRIKSITQNKKELGFMPQETALFEEFTIAETLRFYANLYRIPEDKFQSKVKELKEILDLPRDDQLCSTLSGGQIRRVSIAVTILHSPLLVVLDEPTSGLDPLLANLFWRYLQELSAHQGQTIIITTHYIEEARQANSVGLMRNGVILAEDAPESLISQFNVDSLEDVFLCLCEKQNATQELEAENKIPFQKIYEGNSNNSSMFWPHTIAIMYKNMKWVQRNVVMFVLISFILSAVCIYECNEILTMFPPMRIGVINQSPNGCVNYDYDKFNCSVESDIDLSCHFIKMWGEIKKDMPMILYDDLNLAIKEGKKRNLVTILDIPSNFTTGALARFADGWAIENELLESSIIDVRVDTTDFMAPFKIEQSLRDVLVSLFRTLLKNCDYNPKAADLPPMNINTKYFLGENIHHDPDDFSMNVSLAIMCGITYVGPLLLLTISLCLEKISGAYTRCFAGGVKIVEIFTAYGICLSIFNFLNICLMMFSQFGYYQQPYGNNLLLVFALLNYLGLSGIFFGLFVILMSSHLMVSAGVTISISVTLYIFTGYCWPIEAARVYFLRYISSTVLPNTLVLKSFLAIVLKNADIFNKQVLYGFGICTVHIVFYLFLIYIIVKKRKEM